MAGFWKKAWKFIWEEDSILSWAVNIIIAFILIKFIVYPGLGFLLTTTHPIVAVVSGSMEHDGSFDDWWESQATCGRVPCTQQQWYKDNGISEDAFRGFSFRNGFNTGDIMLLYGTPLEKLEQGDIIIFQSGRPDPIIHRAVTITEKNGTYSFRTKGDHNWVSYPFESSIDQDRYIGRAVIRIPYLGWVKIGFVKLLEIAGVI